MKNNKKDLIGMMAAFVVLIAGASVLYNKLGSGMNAGLMGFGQNPTTEAGEAEAGNSASSEGADAADSRQESEDSKAADSGQESEDSKAADSAEQSGNGSADAGNAESTEATEAELMQAPDFTVFDADGKEAKLSDFFGKPIILNFWASWCGPCKSEMPAFDELYAEYGDEINFLMVNMTDGSRETVEIAKKYVEKAGYSFPVYYDTEYSAAITYSVMTLPTTYFIDAAGNLVAQGKSALDKETILTGIDMILPETE